MTDKVSCVSYVVHNAAANCSVSCCNLQSDDVISLMLIAQQASHQCGRMLLRAYCDTVIHVAVSILI